MEYQIFQPHPLLRPLVKDYWMLTSNSDNIAPPERFLSDGGLEISFNLGDSLEYRGEKNVAIKSGTGSLFGIPNRFLHIRTGGSVHCFGIRFRPGGAYPFFSLPAVEFKNECLNLEDVWGRLGIELQEQIHAEAYHKKRIAILDSFLTGQLENIYDSDTLLENAFNLVYAARGDIRIESLAARLKIGLRRLERLFRDKVGMSPKQFCRLIRFRALFESLTRESTASWAVTAQNFGYYDQSHLIDDFHFFTDNSPGIFFRSNSTGMTLPEKNESLSDFSNTAIPEPVIIFP